MAKYTPHPLSEEDKRLARSEDSFSRFLLAFAIAAAYGVIAFFTVWKLHETVPALLLHLLPGVRDGNPVRLYKALVILVAGLGWFVSLLFLLFRCNRPNLSLKKRLCSLFIWCAAAILIYLAAAAIPRFLL